MINDNAFKELALNCPNLVHVSLQNCFVCCFFLFFLNSIYFKIEKALSKFVFFYVFLKNLTDDSLVALASNCHTLQFLCISNCKNLTDLTLNALGKNCFDLRILEASGCVLLSDVGFATLAKVRKHCFY